MSPLSKLLFIGIDSGDKDVILEMSRSGDLPVLGSLLETSAVGLTRNPLGLAFDLEGRLWAVEMGPDGGDELNLIKRGANYGYPVVSNGDHYDGRPIPDHDTRPEFAAPAVSWTPVISPGNLLFYRGKLFPDWQGDALIAGLSSQAIIRVEIDGERAREVERYPMGARIRSVVEAPDGALWVLEDERARTGGRLLRLIPK